MIAFDEALNRVLAQARRLNDTEVVALPDSPGRVLAEDVTSDRDLPPFNRVAMDGYACRRADIDAPMTVIETVPAGRAPRQTVGRGQCSKVMTGCPLPEGADMVFMVEYSEETGENQVRCTGSGKQIARDNYALQGEDVKSGEVVLKAGTRIQPGHIGVMASVGCASPVVAVRPKVGIIATGDEIVEPSEKPAPAQIRNSNSWQLMTQIRRAGAEPVYYGIAPDNAEAIGTMLQEAAESCDAVLLSGGVSMGDFDLVPGVMKSLGFEIIFDKVAVKPGKPTTLAVSDRAVVFGMPGNPVSTFVIFELMVRPFLNRLMGDEAPLESLMLPLAHNYARKKGGRETWVPVTVSPDGSVIPVAYHGSGHFHALSDARGLMRLSADTLELKQGSHVHVRFI